VRVDGDRANAKFRRGAKDSNSDFATVGDQKSFNFSHGRDVVAEFLGGECRGGPSLHRLMRYAQVILRLKSGMTA
jgi:hypothetical protein